MGQVQLIIFSVIEDHTYIFNLSINSSSHPFQIQTTDGTHLTNSTGGPWITSYCTRWYSYRGTGSNGKYEGFDLEDSTFGSNSTN